MKQDILPVAAFVNLLPVGNIDFPVAHYSNFLRLQFPMV